MEKEEQVAGLVGPVYLSFGKWTKKNHEESKGSNDRTERMLAG